MERLHWSRSSDCMEITYSKTLETLCPSNHYCLVFVPLTRCLIKLQRTWHPLSPRMCRRLAFCATEKKVYTHTHTPPAAHARGATKESRNCCLTPYWNDGIRLRDEFRAYIALVRTNADMKPLQLSLSIDRGSLALDAANITVVAVSAVCTLVCHENSPFSPSFRLWRRRQVCCDVCQGREEKNKTITHYSVPVKRGARW